MAYSEAQKRATMNYRKRYLTRIAIDIRPEAKMKYREAAEVRGMSLAQFAQLSMDEYIQNHPVGDGTP